MVVTISLLLISPSCSISFRHPQIISNEPPVDTTDQLSDEQILSNFIALNKFHVFKGGRIFNRDIWKGKIRPYIFDLAKEQNKFVKTITKESLSTLSKISGIEIDHGARSKYVQDNFVVLHLSKEEIQDIQHIIKIKTDLGSSERKGYIKPLYDETNPTLIYTVSNSYYTSEMSEWLEFLSAFALGLDPNSRKKMEIEMNDLCASIQLRNHSYSYFKLVFIIVPKELSK